MNVARLNFSHGDHIDHAKLVKMIRSASKKQGVHVAILQDLQGPKIRVGELPEKGIELKQGKTAVFDTSKKKYSGKGIPVDYKELHKVVKKGDRILLNDGRVETVVKSVVKTRITVGVKNSGVITSHKGLNIPDSVLSTSALTKKDRVDARFGVEMGVDMMALSFVTDQKDIKDLRRVISSHQKKKRIKGYFPIIAKIERARAVDHIEEILKQADGIMVARGDLGIETPAASVPIVQKKLIEIARSHAKPVIVATQMLDSMQENPRPTRAEVSDVANAVIDHADALMLSNETATGEYPIEAVKMMREIITETEKSEYDDLPRLHSGEHRHEIDDVVSTASRAIAEDSSASVVVCGSLTGNTARLLARNRPELPVIVLTEDSRVARQLNLSWGLTPYVVKSAKTLKQLVSQAKKLLKKGKLVRKGGSFVLVATGDSAKKIGVTNMVEVVKV